VFKSLHIWFLNNPGLVKGLVVAKLFGWER
jgi:hypothetical protein